MAVNQKISALNSLLAANLDATNDTMPIVDTSDVETKKISVKDAVDGYVNVNPLLIGGTVTIKNSIASAVQSAALVAASQTNGGLIISTNGTGALMRVTPDSTFVGGNARGDYATDLQRTRNNPDEVASGDYATVSGGISNKASGDYSMIVGGQQNQTLQPHGVVAGGLDNVNNGDRSVIVGGQENSSNASHSFVGGGYLNQTNVGYSTVSGGRSNVTSTNNYSSVIGGFQNTSSGQYAITGGFSNVASGTASIAIGYDNSATLTGSIAIGYESVADILHGVAIGYQVTAVYPDGTTVKNLAIANYASLNFANDSDAATGGVPLGGIYHNSGALQIRLT